MTGTLQSAVAIRRLQREQDESDDAVAQIVPKELGGCARSGSVDQRLTLCPYCACTVPVRFIAGEGAAEVVPEGFGNPLAVNGNG